MLAQRIIHFILRWADMLNCRLKVGAFVLWFLFSDQFTKGLATITVLQVDLLERVRHLTNRIYREMLCIRGHERLTYITMG